MAVKDPRTILGILTDLERLRESGKSQGMRQFKRWLVRADAELVSVLAGTDRPPVRVHLRDLSWGGMGFVSSEPLPVNSHWRINFLNGDYVIGEQDAIMRHCRRVEDGLYLIGCQYVLSAGLMQMLGVNPASAMQHLSDKNDEAGDFESPNQIG